MSKTVDRIIAEARAYAKAAENDEDKLLMLMGTISPDAPDLFTFRNGVLSMDERAVKAARAKGKAIVQDCLQYLEKAVCDDFGYCARREEVKKAFDTYLPKIVRAILKRIPIRQRIPRWLAKLLKKLGITTVSTEVIVAMLVAWLIVKGCDKLCKCGA